MTLPHGARPPRGAAYAVVPRDLDAIAWCQDMELVLRALAHFHQFPCEVIRLEDNRQIWPWMSPGGSA